MINLHIKVDEHDLLRMINRIYRFQREVLPKEMFDYAKLIERTIKKEIRTGRRTGIKYVFNRKGRRVFHRASAAGEYPKNLTGRLANSIVVDRGRFNQKTHETNTYVGSTVDHGLYLEHGAFRRNNGILFPRPWLKPAIDSTFNQFKYALQSSLRNNL